ncbi:Uncharacterized protein TCM_017904 [Theobroma cacao]|uniref:SWIM-type domain-containing protein n=1 Tax=Theobroma cacao TaxID=3641 RepID=A0A061EF49_THECC|nr:Uncharacterized protein TCM_017904 [Theobroma cacao]
MQPSGETVEGVMLFSNETATLKDEITMLEDNTASDQANEDLVPTDEDRFVDNLDDRPDEWHDDNNNLIAGNNRIRSPKALPDDSYQERGNRGIPHTWLILSAECIGHVEDEDSWTWFLSKLHDTIGCPKNTMFMFDQHFGIKKVIQSAYPEAHHDLCFYHLKQNFKNKFKHDDVSMIFTPARDYYKHARQMPIIVLIEFIGDMFQHWFHDWYKEAIKVTTPLSLGAVRNMDELASRSRKACSCCEFQIDLQPCSHAIVAVSGATRSGELRDAITYVVTKLDPLDNTPALITYL